jgi:hypothetical protein
MRVLVFLAVCLVAVALLTAGCGGYGGGSNNKPKSGTTTNSGY